MMALKETTFSYDINIAYVFNGEENYIDKERINSLVINYDYEKMYSPIMYLYVNLPLPIGFISRPYFLL